MMKVRKKLFTLSGLFMVLAQIFVAAFCGITAIAVTQEETTQSLYSNEYGSAAMSYELLGNDRIKWTLTLAKTGQQTATQFMVDLAVDGTSLVPENVTSEGISLIGASSNGHIQAGLSETATTMGGSGTVTFETARAIGTLTATPRLITSVEVPVETPVTVMAAEVTTETPGEETEAIQPAEEPPVQTETIVTNLLDGVGQTTFDIPDVEVVEEIDPVEPELPVADGGEESNLAGDVVEKSNDSTGTGGINQQAAGSSINTLTAPIPEDIQRNTNDSTTNWTSLRVEKDWSTSPEDSPSVTLQLMRRQQGESEYVPYDFNGDGNSNYTLERSQSVMEWNKLPVYDEDGGPYEYTARELDNLYYDIVQDYEKPTESAINALYTATTCNTTTWSMQNPSFLIVRHGGTGWTIWTASHLSVDDREAFIKSVKAHISKGDYGPPANHFQSISLNDNITWAEGDTVFPGILTVKVTAGETGAITVKLDFVDTSVWTQLMYGGHSMREVGIKNTYIPQNDITIQKVWADNDSSTREPIRLELQQKIEGEEWSLYDSFDIETDAATLSKDYTVPSKVGGKSAIYRVVEFVKNSDGTYEQRNVTGYKAPAYSHPDGAAEGILKVTNELIEYNITVRKIWNDGANEGNTRKNIQLILEQSLDDGTTWTEWTKYSVDNDAEDTELSHQFTVPAAVGGKSAKYRVIEKVQQAGETDQYTGDRVPGYATPVYSKPGGTSEDDTLTVTNTLLAMGLNFTKVGNDGETPLSGVKFTITGTTTGGNPYSAEVTSQDITGAIGQVAFTDLQEGSYTLSETAPVGYESAGPWTFDVVYEAGELSIDWGEGITPPIQDGKLVNKLKKFDLIVNKKDDLGNALEGATFTLTGPEGFTTQVLPPNVNSPKVSTFTFTGLEPGEYELTETNAPDGYTLLSGEITITISDTGQVQVTGNNISEIDSDLTGGPVNNTITFSVTNKKKVPLPATGGSGTMMFVTIGVLALTATGLYFLKRKDQEVA